jgi:hypothetical protein
MAAVVTAGLVVACDATVETRSVEPHASASQAVDPSPSPTERSFEPIPSFCVGDTGSNTSLSFHVDAFRFPAGLGIHATSERRLDGSRPTVTHMPSDQETGDPAQVFGGQDLVIRAEGADIGLLQDSTLEFSFEPVGEYPIMLTMAPAAAGEMHLSIPDVGGEAVIRVSATWRDDCIEYSGAASLFVSVIPRALVDACQSSDEAFVAMINSHNGAEVSVAGMRVPFSIDEWSERYGGRGAAIDGAWLFGFDESAPVVDATTGSLLTYAVIEPELRLLGARVEFYSRQAVLDQTIGEALFWANRTTTNPATSFDLAVPDRRGRYAAFATFLWELPCALGGAHALIGVDVE